MRGILFVRFLGWEQEVTEETEKIPISNLCYLGYLLLNFLFENELG